MTRTDAPDATTHWENSIKIHEGCGGHVVWTPDPRDTVMHSGECDNCDADQIPVEDILPVRTRVSPDVLFRLRDRKLRRLSWNPEQNFEENQERLRDELGVEPPRDTGRTTTTRVRQKTLDEITA